VQPRTVNRVGTVHGGLIMSLTDTLGSLAVEFKGHYMTGVSTDISTSSIRPAGKVGDVLSATATLTAMGTEWSEKSLAYILVDFTNGKGELAADRSEPPIVTISVRCPQPSLHPRTRPKE
ncbi:hypothetical protein HYDPIDRAFT_101410, partial [Hydnomerulius pinastri MD-312]